jgi:tetratricopeptide (TPR) repeat protein
VAKALVNKANGLGRLGRGEETIRVCEEVVSRFGDAPEAGIREQVARALFGKSMTLGGLGRREEEIRGYEEVVSRFGDAPECGIRDLVAIALTNKADTLVQLGHGEEAIVVFEEVVSRFGDAPEAGIREQVAKAQTARDTVLRAGESRGEAERATLLLAENLMRQGRFADAVGLLDDLLARLGTFSCPVDRTTAEWGSELRRDALRHGGR